MFLTFCSCHATCDSWTPVRPVRPCPVRPRLVRPCAVRPSRPSAARPSVSRLRPVRPCVCPSVRRPSVSRPSGSRPMPLLYQKGGVFKRQEKTLPVVLPSVLPVLPAVPSLPQSYLPVFLASVLRSAQLRFALLCLARALLCFPRVGPAPLFLSSLLLTFLSFLPFLRFLTPIFPSSLLLSFALLGFALLC